jgi:hypothetical protein
MHASPGPNLKGAVMPKNWKSINDAAQEAVRNAEIERLKRLMIEFIKTGHNELGEAYHHKILRLGGSLK